MSNNKQKVGGQHVVARVQPLEMLKVHRTRLSHGPSWMLLTTMGEK